MGGGEDDSDEGIDLIHLPARLDPRCILGYACVTEQSGGAIVACFRIYFHPALLAAGMPALP